MKAGKKKGKDRWEPIITAETIRDTIKLGIPASARGKLGAIKIVSDEEANEAEFVVCMLDGSGEYFNDDLRTSCFVCGRGIHHRPHVPKKPHKVCIACLNAMTGEVD
ncbi:MAG: hypothetical protein ACYDCQ_12985 [Dehalococcoidia bacterium]